MPLPPGARRRAAALALPAAISLAALARMQPPEAAGDDAPAAGFSASRAVALVRELAGGGEPRPVGSRAGGRAIDLAVSRLRAAGLETSVQEAFACGIYGTCARVRNVVARLGGPPGRKAVMLAAHHDSVAAGPGAADDLSGVAAAIEAARAAAAGPPLARPLLVVLTDGEEASLVGASAFADRHPAAAEVGAVVNLEARGTTGPSIAFDASGAPAWIGRVLRALPRPVTTSVAPAIYDLLPNDTDLTTFERAGLPGVNLAFAFGAVRYHTPLDDVAHLDPRSVQHHGENALALVRALAKEDLEAGARGDHAWFDVLGATVISWPAPRWVALAAALLALVAVLAALRGEPRVLRSAAAGVAAAVAAPAVAAGTTALLVAALAAAGALPRPFVATPAPTYAAAWAAGAAGALLAPAAFARSAGPAGLRAGAALLFGALSAALGLALPLASHVAAVPAAACAAAAAARRFVPPGGRAAIVVDALPAAAAAIVLAPLALLLPPMMGAPATPACAAVVALVLFPAAAAAVPGEGRRLLPGTAALAVALALGAAQAALPHANRDSPERLTFVLHEEDGRARWLAEAEHDTLPAAVRAAAPFSERRSAPFPWSGARLAFSAPAAPVGLPPPRLEVLSSRVDAGVRRVRARLVSPARSPVLLLALPPGTAVVAAAVDGVALAVPPRLAASLRGGHRLIGSMTAPPEGVTLDVAIRGDEPVQASLAAISGSLPPSAEPLLSARPLTAVPSADGDAVVVTARVRL